MKHIGISMVQSIPVNNVNRGQNGEVKTAVFGGTIRQRISSQASKRPIRMSINDWCVLNGHNFGIFSRIHGSEIKARLAREGIVIDNIDSVLTDIGLGIKSTDLENESKQNKTKKSDTDTGNNEDNTNNTKKTDTTMYLSSNEYDVICKLIKEHRVSDYVGKTTKRDATKAIKGLLAKLLADAGCRSPYDISTFGRMFASNSELNINAALKMNHPFSTHAIVREVDYFTAVDQLDMNGGASHIDTTEFTSSTMYRYITIDLDQLGVNLSGIDYKEYLRVLIKACITAFPSGKCTSMNSGTFPSYVYLTLEDGVQHQLCNAFEKAIPATSEGFLRPSINALKQYAENDRKSGMGCVVKYVEWEENTGTNINSVIDTIISAI